MTLRLLKPAFVTTWNLPVQISLLPFNLLRRALVMQQQKNPLYQGLNQAETGGVDMTAMLPASGMRDLHNGTVSMRGLGGPGVVDNAVGGAQAVVRARAEARRLATVAVAQANILTAEILARAAQIKTIQLPRSSGRMPQVMPGMRVFGIPYMPRAALPVQLQERVESIKNAPWGYR